MGHSAHASPATSGTLLEFAGPVSRRALALAESAAIPATLEPGFQVGEYEIVGVLAQGGMSMVYEAIHPLIGKRAAIKVISQRLSSDAHAIEQFTQEARAVNEVRHPNIVDVFSCGRLADGRSYLIMEWLEGETLAHRLRQGRLSVGESYDILVQICDALDATHEKQIVHLDLKPDNVYLVSVRGGRTLVKLLDFGIAKVVPREPAADAPPAECFNGTPDYASPEQAQGLSTVDQKSDSYSFGVMAYEMFVGCRPFAAPRIVELLLKHINEPPSAPSLLWPEIPRDLELLLLQLLYKSPSRRPTLAAARERLFALREQMNMVSTHTISCVRRAPERAARWLALVAALIVPLAAGAWNLNRGVRTPPVVRVDAPLVASADPVVTPLPLAAEKPASSLRGAAAIVVPKRTHRRRAERTAPVATASRRDYLIDYAGKWR